MKSPKLQNALQKSYLWTNLLAMLAVVVALAIGVRYGLAFYTHHGERIPVPNLYHKDVADAERLLKDAGLELVVRDTGYVKTLPPDCVLEQIPAAGEVVKGGRTVYVTVNALNSPTITLPDVIDNSSFREAMAKLKGMGFKLGDPQFVPGEQDWVYGILVRGKHVVAGDKISVEDKLIIQVGNGRRDTLDTYNVVREPLYEETPMEEDMGEDDFEEVVVPEED